MSFKSFAVSFRGAPNAAPVVSRPAHSRRNVWPARVAGCVAGVHTLIAAPAARPAATREGGVPRVRRVRAVAARHVTRAAVLAALIAMSPVGDELESALPLCWWFV